MEKIAFLRSFDIEWLSPYVEEVTSGAVGGTRPKLFCTEDPGDLSAYCPEFELLAPQATCEEFVERICRWGADGAISLSWPDENSVRDAAVGETLRSIGIPMVMHGQEITARFSDKWETRRIVRDFGLETPGGELLEAGRLKGNTWSGLAYRHFIEQKAARLGYPLLAKPLWGCSAEGILFIEDAAAMRRFLDEPPEAGVVLEKCLSGELCSVEIIGHDGNYILQPLVWKGATGGAPTLMSERVRICARRQQAETDFLPVARQLRKLSTEAEVCGAIEVEMIYVDGSYQVIEINPRTSGTTVISTAASGCNTFQCLQDILRGRWSADRARALEQHPYCAAQIPVAPALASGPAWAGPGVSGFEVVRTRHFAYHGQDFGELLIRCPAADLRTFMDRLDGLRAELALPRLDMGAVHDELLPELRADAA
ncbi:ATP-grasp domain-containing protein [Streptomyces sp. I05A-00742]|uniref:ATP-grasp domain-containing protein n=1 Tax=Streptomyces sp. I05A-00742 TaxID=2732853 RepID=UPI0014899D08|nr:ATP-grasp domain-containing protein [Streptomyces sp. I05A-00742]